MTENEDMVLIGGRQVCRQPLVKCVCDASINSPGTVFIAVYIQSDKVGVLIIKAVRCIWTGGPDPG